MENIKNENSRDNNLGVQTGKVWYEAQNWPQNPLRSDRTLELSPGWDFVRSSWLRWREADNLSGTGCSRVWWESELRLPRSSCHNSLHDSALSPHREPTQPVIFLFKWGHIVISQLTLQMNIFSGTPHARGGLLPLTINSQIKHKSLSLIQYKNDGFHKKWILYLPIKCVFELI